MSTSDMYAHKKSFDAGFKDGYAAGLAAGMRKERREMKRDARTLWSVSPEAWGVVLDWLASRAKRRMDG